MWHAKGMSGELNGRRMRAVIIGFQALGDSHGDIYKHSRI